MQMLYKTIKLYTIDTISLIRYTLFCNIMDFKNTSPKKSNAGKIVALILIAVGLLFLSGSIKVELNASEEEVSDSADVEVSNVTTSYKEAKLPVYFFTSSWCGNCQVIENKMKSLAGNFPNATFMILNIEEYRDLANQYEIFLTPGLVFPKETNSVVYSEIEAQDLEKLFNINLLQVD